jgi:CHAD domain-containing protein
MAKQKVPPWQGSKTVAENARRVLPVLAERYLEESRKVLEVDLSPQALRRWGVETERFQYTLELFRSCYGPSLDSRLTVLRQLQKQLGVLADYAGCRALVPEEATQFLAYLDRQTARQTARVLRLARKHFEGRASRWAGSLRRVRTGK